MMLVKKLLLFKFLKVLLDLTQKKRWLGLLDRASSCLFRWICWVGFSLEAASLQMVVQRLFLKHIGMFMVIQ